MTDLVTVVTSTWQRPQTLMNACRSVSNQTYGAIEHVVVIDGDDPATEAALEGIGYKRGTGPYRYFALGRNWSSFSGDGGYGATCRLVGAWLGGGEYIAYLDDDVEYDPHHVETYVSLFEPGTMFVSGQWHGGCAEAPPRTGYADTSGVMHRAIALKIAGGFRPDGYTSDGNMLERFVAAGLPWRFHPFPTFRHPTGCHHGGPMP